MANLNKYLAIGRLTRDPETRTFASGGKVCEFGFAVTGQRRKNAAGEWEDEPCFWDAKAFNRDKGAQLADLAERYLHKGDLVFLEAHVVLETWDDKKTGEKRRAHKLLIDRMEFLQPKNGDGGNTAPVRSAPRPTSRPAPQTARGDSYEENERMGGTEEIPF